MKKVVKYIYPLILSFVFVSFANEDEGNKNGGPAYSRSNIDGVFTVYNLQRELNFGQPAVKNKKYIAYFLQTRGDTTTKFFNGNLSFSNHNLIYNSNRFYTDNNIDSIGNNGNGNNKWNSVGNNQSSFEYHFKRGIADLKMDGDDKINDTIKIHSGLHLGFDGVKNADSIIVTITAFNGSVINKRFNGLAKSVDITPAELTNFISGGMISISAFSILPVTINNKNYLFGSINQYLKMVYYKN